MRPHAYKTWWANRINYGDHGYVDGYFKIYYMLHDLMKYKFIINHE